MIIDGEGLDYEQSPRGIYRSGKEISGRLTDLLDACEEMEKMFSEMEEEELNSLAAIFKTLQVAFNYAEGITRGVF